MSIFSYVIPHDSGFAPNPFGRFLTLATCKPKIRLTAKKGDFIVGTGSKNTVGTGCLVYAARVSKVITIEVYGASSEYSMKRPSSQGNWRRECGDNIYRKVNGQWSQTPNRHHSRSEMSHDLSGKNVFICRSFSYFGGSAPVIPRHLHSIIKAGSFHKRIDDERLLEEFVDWFGTLPAGRIGMPWDSSESTAGCVAGVC